MNRKEVEDILNQQLQASSCFKLLDDFYKEFQIWEEALRKDVKNLLSGKKRMVISVPTTPAAACRMQSRLSVITESPGGDTVKLIRKSGTKRNCSTVSENANAESHCSVRENPSKRTKLTFDVPDEETDGVTEAVDLISQDSLHSYALHAQALEPKSLLGDVNQTNSRKGSNEMTRNSSRNMIDSESNVQRNTRTSLNVGDSLKSKDLYPEDNCSTDSTNTSLSETGRKKQQSTSKRKGRPKKHSNIVRSKMFTIPKRITRSNSRAYKDVVYQPLEKVHQDSVDVSPTLSHTSLSKSAREGIDSISIEENKRTSGRKTTTMNRSIVGHEKISTTSTTNVRSISKVSENLGCEALGSVLDIVPEMSQISQSVNSNNSQELRCKDFSVRLTRIDKTIENLPHTVNTTEEVHQMCSENNISVSSKESTSKSGDCPGRRSLDRNSISEKRKRNVSCSNDQLPRKKSHLHENDTENKDTNIAANDVNEGKTRSTLHLSFPNQSLSITASCKRKSRSSAISEVVSFSEHVSSKERVSGSEIFENCIGIKNSEEEEGESKDKQNNKANSGKENSTDSEVECSEYYSVGSKVDVVDSAEPGQEDANACNAPVPVAGSEQMQSQRNKSEKLVVTPDTRGTRKGAHAALFSPYANEPVKNRVAAYEVLSSLAEEVEIPVTTKRVTRTKTRAMAAAAAAAAEAGVLEQKHQMNSSSTKPGPARKLATASAWRAKKKLATAPAPKSDASKENSFVSSAMNIITGKTFNFTPLPGSKILADVNGLSSSQLNSSRKTPMIGPKPFTVTSGNQSSKSAYKPGVIHTDMLTFVKKNTKPGEDPETKKKEEQKKREEKEREAQLRREENLRKHAEEKKRKRNENMLRVQEKREAQEKEKQESKLRLGKEKNQKWNIIQQEREAKQKGNLLKKRMEAERKAAEAKRKFEETENARLAKLRMEDLQRKKENEEIEKERQRHILEEKERALLREKTEQKMREALVLANEKAASQKNTDVPKLQVKEIKALDVTFTNPLDSTFTKPLDSTFTKPLDSTFTKPLDSTFTKSQNSQNSTLNLIFSQKPGLPNKKNNAYNLEDLPSGDSEDEMEEPPKKVARWALRSEILRSSLWEQHIDDIAPDFFCTPKTINFSAIFANKKLLKRTSSAIWHTPPRYSCLPKY